MKKLSVSGILLLSLSVLILNSCNKSNNTTGAGGSQDSTSVSTPSGQTFDLEYVVTPLSKSIQSITFNDENGISQTVYNPDLLMNGIQELTVRAHSFKARISVEVGNMIDHPLGLRLQIKVNGQTKLAKDFTVPSLTSFTAVAEYDVQLD